MFNLVMGIVMIGIGTICLVKGCVGTLSPVMIFFGCCMIVFGIVEIIRMSATGNSFASASAADLK